MTAPNAFAEIRTALANLAANTDKAVAHHLEVARELAEAKAQRDQLHERIARYQHLFATTGTCACSDVHEKSCEWRRQ